ncbi:hypothetical protein DRN73_06300 [Candidatus Pacearchaeota archaeon]|nr:MAG: hypothetical protein DRN73_06300 [Candidatus Pacearchaeota archaeon]
MRNSKPKPLVNLHLNFEERYPKIPEEENLLRESEGYFVLYSDGTLKRGYDHKLCLVKGDLDFHWARDFHIHIGRAVFDVDLSQKRLNEYAEYIKSYSAEPLHTLTAFYASKAILSEDEDSRRVALENRLKDFFDVEEFKEKSIAKSKRTMLKLLENRYRKEIARHFGAKELRFRRKGRLAQVL